MKNFSIIISYRESHPDRRDNLELCLRYLEQNKRDNFEVIVVEQDVKSKLSSSFYRHIFLYNPGYFNKGWAYNVGAINAESDKLVFCDCDLLIKFNELLDAVSYLEKYDAVNPKGKIYDLDEDTVDPFSYRGKLRIGFNFAGGLLLIQKRTFFEIGGWDEDFAGWGKEDDAMEIKILALTSHISLNFELFHLFHADSVGASNKDTSKRYLEPNNILILSSYIQNNKERYAKNEEILEKIKKLNEQGKDKLLEYYENKGPIGCIDKYKELI